MARNDNVATVLAFEKKLVPSDGFFYGTTWEDRYTNAFPLTLMEKSVRGTISNRLKKAMQADPAKLDAEVEKPNLQKVDCCSLSENQDTLKIQFTLKVLSNIEKPSASNNAGFNESYKAAVKNYIQHTGFSELAKRYALNIANARFLWRNRVGAEKIEVKVQVLNATGIQSWTFDSTKFSLFDFDVNDEDVNSLAKKIAQALSGEIPFLLLDINAYAQIGKAQEVYPSEELILDKSNNKNKKSKILYQINNIAGMHSQKIGNALRSIDTWYPDFEEVTTGPIAIEPYGAVTNLGIAYRNPKNKSDFFTLFDKFARGEPLETEAQEHYVMAVLVRGGVFGESGKD
ncbi:type I-F CRISPR-associated protein Csy3 [Legionella maceachernii]|uniref:CRISPR-associated protein Csy3 n=1 Tax=Legionella maceachernii TaxID=466 RepID=A0A0W0WDY9_9GAMM|nr:type I-F CRISPR-associated protein Csy3 [Legionella maceachernii]KTD30593.1 CRISPR-associated protein Csy3 [Legionella maceachernii]SJZ97763.1 CRISPR-associated protein, Csy3 family [Legionella maceachernii]SUP01098.1 CRISPR type I-F/YPEST-associated protein Csy3 [Legionella maceachernii]